MIPVRYLKRITSGDLSLRILARLGYSRRTLRDWTGLGDGQITRRLKWMGIRLKDYRDGQSDVAQRMIQVATRMADAEFKEMTHEIVHILKDKDASTHQR